MFRDIFNVAELGPATSNIRGTFLHTDQ